MDVGAGCCGFAVDSRLSIRPDASGRNPKGEGIRREAGPLRAREGCLILNGIRLQRFHAAHRASCNAGFEIRNTRRQPR